MSVRKGTYALFVTFDRDINITVGALGPHLFRAGTYCYVGSAMGGLDQRVSRHLARCKGIRWHIDRLTTVCDGSEAWESYPDFIGECELARIAEECGGIPEMDGFGVRTAAAGRIFSGWIPGPRMNWCPGHVWRGSRTVVRSDNIIK